MRRPMMLAISGLLLVVMSLGVQLWLFQNSEAAHATDSQSWAKDAILSPYGASAGRIPTEGRYRRLELAAPAVLAERAREMDLEARELAARRTLHQREMAMRNDTRRDRLNAARIGVERFVVQATPDDEGRRTVVLDPLGTPGPADSRIIYTMAITDSGARP